MIENKVNIKNIIIVSISVLLLISIMIIYNLNIISFEKKEVLGETKEVTTINEIKADIEDKILVDGSYEDIRLKTYISHLGYSISYDIDNFELISLSNGSIRIKDDYNYIEIKKLTSEEYYLSYENKTNNEIDGKKIYYQYYHGESIYLEITISIDKVTKTNSNLARITYMLNTLIVS